MMTVVTVGVTPLPVMASKSHWVGPASPSHQAKCDWNFPKPTEMGLLNNEG